MILSLRSKGVQHDRLTEVTMLQAYAFDDSSGRDAL